MSGQKIYKNKPMKASMDMMVFNLIGTILVVFLHWRVSYRSTWY